ncbi:glycoside hydrolase family 31 protein [Algoriphagus sp. A40]|uniref:glycoside hydrolase family 31 protein n=1 Tax=Algoriphagus sp. A40 TaxID=1945863 RepID=UPI000985F5D3|nr:glycoside hydrolase family 31 protein [Algoriphagus sp. A40]OOG77088.1 glycoside hydrolase family 31 [Algoriphagus sp. A40]
MNTSTSVSKFSRNSARYRGFGEVKEWHSTRFGLEGKSDFAHFRICVFQDGIIRVQASLFENFESNPYSVIAFPENVHFELIEKESQLILTTSLLRMILHLKTFNLSFFDLEGKLLNADDSLGVSWIGSEVTAYKQVQKEEKFIGLGEKTGNLNRFGNAFTNWNTDYFAYGVGDDPLYMSIPFYMGVHEKGAYGIFFDNTHKTVFNFGASTNRFVYFSAEDGDLDYYFIHQPTVTEIISSYTWLTGRMQMPPKWALGFQQCRYSYYPDSEVYTVAQTFRDKKMPADVIYLDIHHMEGYKVFTFDGEKFSDPKAMISRLKEKGFKVVVIMDPGIKSQKGYLPYTEGLKEDLFVKYPDGKTYEAQVWPGWCAFPDFTKEETRSWWAEKMAFYTDAGVDGFWTDMNEPASWGQFTPNLIEFEYEGEKASHRKARNIYGMQMARSAKEGSAFQNPDKRPFVLTRSGFAGIQRFAAAWTGDNVASEEHMLAGIRLVNSLGLSGVSFAGYDVGGFAGEASKSLFARWMSIAAFAPFYRAHSMINSKDAEPWAFGEEVEEISRNYMKLRYRLLTTLYSKFYSSSQSGLPVAESLAVQFTQDQTIYQSAFQNQYLFCDSFLVAPVESTKGITKVYLPEGGWYYLYSDQKHSGIQTIYQDCPLNYLPIYVKGGQIFTMQSDVAFTEGTHDGILRIHVYKGKTGSEYLHYEDAGEGLEYLSDVFFKRKIKYDSKSETLTFDSVEGKYPSDFKTLKIYFHGFSNDTVSLADKNFKLQREDFAFLGKLTEFDPLPEHNHPYFEIKNLPYFELDHLTEPFEILGLK